jgi:hypothetical protein
MQGVLIWVLGGGVAIVGILGLYLASRAHDGGVYLFGLALFIFAVAYVFSLIKQSFDRSERKSGADSGRFAP